MRSGGVHHVDLVVSSIERSLPFYRELLGPLGWHGISEVEGERGETIWYLLGTATQIGLREMQTDEGAYDRYSVGLHHLARRDRHVDAVVAQVRRARPADAVLDQHAEPPARSLHAPPRLRHVEAHQRLDLSRAHHHRR